jgi:hypothetical protein
MMMDVPEGVDEAEFNDLYSHEHVPALLKVPGVRAARRYRLERSDAGTDLPRYLAVYELDSPDVRDSAAWKDAVDIGEWGRRIRPKVKRRVAAVYTPIDDA